MEKAAECDETLLDKFLTENTLTESEIINGIRKGTVAGKIYPVFCGSSLKNMGVQLMLDGVVAFLPSPLDVPSAVGVNPDSGEEEIRKPDNAEPFS